MICSIPLPRVAGYVGWTDDDARRVAAAAPPLEEPFLVSLVDDFYEEIDRHPNAPQGHHRRPRTDPSALKGTLGQWLRELLSGRYDAAYVAAPAGASAWQRHVEIGLDQVYTNVAMSRLRSGLLHALDAAWSGGAEDYRATSRGFQ